MTLLSFLAGMITLGYALGGLFFIRSWKRTGDSLFIAFGLAFWLLGIHQALLAFSSAPIEDRTPLYLIRLLAFSLIIAAIFVKNRRRMTSADDS